MTRVLSASLLFCLAGVGCAAERAQDDTLAAQTVLLKVEQTTLHCPKGLPDAGTPSTTCAVVATKALNVICNRGSAYGMPPGQAHACGEDWDHCKDGHTYGLICHTESGLLSCSCRVDGRETSAFVPSASFCEFPGSTQDDQIWIQNCEFHTTLIL